MQQTQQSKPPQSQSRHLVLPGAVPLGLMIELVAEPGRTKSTGLEVDLVHMALEGCEGRRGSATGSCRERSETLKTSYSTTARDTYLCYFYIDRKT